MDLDLTLVRSFVATAEELHFGRAAERLSVSQQAVSQRVRRLEDALGAALFLRGGRGAELTEEGRRFLAPARQALDAARAAVASVRPAQPPAPLRVDVVDGRLTPVRFVRRLTEECPGLPVHLGMRQTLAAALPALVRGEIDAAFGRVHDVRPWPAEATHRLVRLEPLHALVLPDHPWAGREALRVEELRADGVWLPHYGQASEWEQYVRRLAEGFAVPLTRCGPAFSEEHFVHLMRERPTQATLAGADVDYAHGAALRSVPLLAPAPLYPWSLVRHRDRRHPAVELLARLAERSAPELLRYDADAHWLPDADRTLLEQSPPPARLAH
ncbi:LysR family transcriptional regulator [Streptomyces sp. NPDC049954]|uniref:LysR family transcriptional regulator n=1 Tax=Streptomyces sp. NPDC049954 TaxID=3155779 RepID=UPI00342C4C65